MSTRPPARPNALTPICARELYARSPAPGSALWINAGYLDAGLTRVELATVSRVDDAYVDWTRRVSPDNGRTWSDPVVIPDAVRETPEGGIVVYPAAPFIDPYTGKSYRFSMQRQWPGQKCYTYDWKTGDFRYTDHLFVSEDNGPDQLLRYEPGPDFNPARPFDPEYLHTNNAYFGTHPAFSPDGRVYYAGTCFGKKPTDRRGVGLFTRDPKSGKWSASNLQPLAPELSAVGLEEPASARLADGRVLTVCRGHKTPTMEGVKWMTLAPADGKTLAPMQEFRYADGSRLYSPSSIHRFYRSTRNGKLYWFANILDHPPAGQDPRYPLSVAEIDEAKAGVIKSSVQSLDDRREGEPEALQLSNFSVIENRETLNIEIYITLLGLNAQDFWGADVYRYVFSPPAR
ncbi:MAG: sialidase family protein [Planctomycetota bacterium]|nr:sialidase family protein [Planctomycetota bacterium]